jgi:heptosyltransferase-3
MLKDAIDLSAIKRVLVIKLRHHGDVLLTSPVFSVLKNHAPQLEVDALVYRDTQEMLTLNPHIAQVFTVDRAWRKQGLWSHLSHELCLLKALRARHYDLLIHLTEHPRGASLARLLRPRYRVAREFAAKRGKVWRSSFTHLYKVPATPRHTVEQHLDALRRIGLYPHADERKLVLVAGDDAENTVRALLARFGLTDKGFIHLHPTSRWLFKSWAVDKYSALINELQQLGARIVVTAAPDPRELEVVGRIMAKADKVVVDLSGQLSLKQLAALTAQAKCFVGVDSVPMHIAAAMQTPVVALFGPSSDIDWKPWQVAHRVITAAYSCRPCGLDGCGGGKVSECLTNISVEEVLSAIKQFLPAANIRSA